MRGLTRKFSCDGVETFVAQSSPQIRLIKRRSVTTPSSFLPPSVSIKTDLLKILSILCRRRESLLTAARKRNGLICPHGKKRLERRKRKRSCDCSERALLSALTQSTDGTWRQRRSSCADRSLRTGAEIDVLRPNSTTHSNKNPIKRLISSDFILPSYLLSHQTSAVGPTQQTHARWPHSLRIFIHLSVWRQSRRSDVTLARWRTFRHQRELNNYRQGR